MTRKFIDWSLEFFSWWGSQLFSLLPRTWQKHFRSRRNVLLIQVDSNLVNGLWINGDHQTKLGPFELDGEGPAQWLEVLQQNPEITEAKVILSLTEMQCLYRQISLPLEAKGNLRQVVNFEMDRLTPFYAEQVYFDAQASGLSADRRSLLAQLAVVPKHFLETLMTNLSQFEIRPARVTISNHLTWPLDREGINLLPVYLQPKMDTKNVVFTAGLAVMLLSGVGCFLMYPAWREVQELSRLQAEIQQLQPELEQVSTLRSDVRMLEDQLAATKDILDQHPSALQIYSELSERLPDHTWLTQLRLTGNRLEFQGYSAQATDLISLLDQSPLFDRTRFFSPLTNRNQTEQAFKIGTLIDERPDV